MANYNDNFIRDDDNFTEEDVHDLTEFEMRAERLRQASAHIADYVRRLEELNSRREKAFAILKEMGVKASELRAIEVPDEIIEDIYGNLNGHTAYEHTSYSDGFKSRG